MLGQHHRGLIPAEAVPGDAVIRHLAALTAWRRRSAAEQTLAFRTDDAPFAPSHEPSRGRIRLGLFCPCLGLGGAEAWQLALTRAIDPQAVVWRGAVVTEGKRSVAPAMLSALSERIPVGFGWQAARTLAAATDVIISWSVLDHDALRRGIDPAPKVAWACHFPGEMPWNNEVAAMLAQVDRLVAVSELAVESLPLARRAAAQVIWNAVDGPRLQATRSAAVTRAAWRLPPDARVAGYLGRLAPEKDPAAMLRLAEVLPPPWHVVIVGDGREGGALAEQVARLDLGERVRFVPGSPDVGDVLAAFDTLVVPSRFESFGLTMAEGFWAGVPVVATRVGLAKLVPGLVREIGFVSSGSEIARAIAMDHEHEVDARLARVALARQFAHAHLDLGRFGRQWTDLVRDLARPALAEPPQEERCRSIPSLA